MDYDTEQGQKHAPRRPKTSGFRSTTRRLREGKKHRLKHRASLEWRQDGAHVCLKDHGAEFSVVAIGALVETAEKSKTASALLQQLRPQGLEIVYDAQTASSQLYLANGRCVIALNPNRAVGDLINMMARELRRAWQYHNGAFVNPMLYEPEEAILINRAQQADVLMASIKVAWELKLVGENDAWDFTVGSPMAAVINAFEIHAQKDFRSLNNGEAARAAYDKFFEDSHSRLHDKRLIHQMLLDDAGYMKAPPKSKKVDPKIFSNLGCLPSGANYLTGGKKAPNDAEYYLVEDRSNANFLWFIKFERSFNRKEMEMVKDSVRASAEIVDFAKWAAASFRRQIRQ